LIERIASEKNRVIRLLEDCNIKLSSVLSDTHGVVGTKLIDKLCKTGKVSMEDIEEVYHGKLKASKDEIYAACEGVVTKHHVFMLQRIKENILSCEGSIFKINSQIKSILFPYQNVLELLKAVPGMDTKSSEDLIAEIGLDMSVFPTEKHLASWCGVAPGNDESGSKKKVHASPTATSRSRR